MNTQTLLTSLSKPGSKKLLVASALLTCGLGLSSTAYARQEYANALTNGSCIECHTSGTGDGGNVRVAAIRPFCPGVPNSVTLACLKNYIDSLKPATDTAPVILAIQATVDAEVGQQLSIPLSVNDAEDDSFTMGVKPTNAGTFGAQYTAANNFPTVDFQLTPGTKQANKALKVTFVAQETTSNKLKSTPVTTTIRIWPAGEKNAAVSKLVASAVTWNADVLSIKGKVILNKLLTSSEKSDFVGTPHQLTVTTGTAAGGAAVGSGSVDVSVDAKSLSWSTTLSAPQANGVPCNIYLELESKPATRKVGHAPKDCVK